MLQLAGTAAQTDFYAAGSTSNQFVNRLNLRGSVIRILIDQDSIVASGASPTHLNGLLLGGTNSSGGVTETNEHSSIVDGCQFEVVELIRPIDGPPDGGTPPQFTITLLRALQRSNLVINSVFAVKSNPNYRAGDTNLHVVGTSADNKDILMGPGNFFDASLSNHFSYAPHP